MPSRSLILAIAVASGSSLVLELALTRLFSVTTWYHFAFAVISLALLGLGTGATLVAVLPRWFPRGHERPRMAAVCALAAVAAVAAVVVSLAVPLRIARAWSALAVDGLIIAALLLPFALVGMILALGLRAGAARVGVLYGADLIGAAIGALVFIPTIRWLGGPGVCLASAAGFAVAGLLAADSRRSRVPVAVVAVAVVGLLGLSQIADWELLRPTKATPAPRPDAAFWNAYSYVSVRDRGLAPPFGWGFGLTPHPQTKRRTLGVTLDLNAGTVITEFDGDTALVSYLSHDVTNVAYSLRPEGRVLIMGTGGGRDVLSAIAAGASHVTGVEINDLVLSLITERYRDVAGLAGRDDVSLVHDEARSYLTRHEGPYDVVQASLIDTWAASTSGAFALSENSLYTLEGWTLFLSRLSADGILTMSRWLDPRPAEVARLVSLAVAALERDGATHPEAHIAMLGARRLATILVKRTPFTDADIARIEAECASKGFEPLYVPGRPPGALLAALAGGREAWWGHVAGHHDDLRPPTDDRPFFFYLPRPDEWLRPSELLLQRDAHGKMRVQHMDPQHLLVALLVSSAVAAFLLLVAPPLIAMRRDRSAVPTIPALLYMAAIGLAFMIVEVPLLTRLAIVLGHPVLSLVVVLAGLLVSSGIGSALSGRIGERRVTWVLLTLPLVVIAVAAAIDVTAVSVAALAGPGRIAACAAFVVVLGLPMGMALPTGLRRSAGATGAGTPILFGVNGAFSVLGSILAMLILLNTGARTTMIIGASLYAIAALLATRALPPATPVD